MNLVELAKMAVENFIKEKKIISPPKNLPKEFLERKSGTFVTIMKNGDLRGCIGTYLPTKENIAKEVISNAIAAATEDYRFGSVKKEELPYLTFTVYILSKPELVNPHTTRRIISALRQGRQSSFGVGVKELDPKKYGIIVKTMPIKSADGADGADVVFNGHLPFKSGLLLPDLEGVDTIEKQIFIACQKARIDSTKEKILIYRFTVEKYK